MRGVLRYMIRSRAFVQLSVYLYGADEELVTALPRLGFSADPPWRRITAQRTGESNTLPDLSEHAGEQLEARAR